PTQSSRDRTPATPLADKQERTRDQQPQPQPTAKDRRRGPPTIGRVAGKGLGGLSIDVGHVGRYRQVRCRAGRDGGATPARRGRGAGSGWARFGRPSTVTRNRAVLFDSFGSFG